MGDEKKASFLELEQRAIREAQVREDLEIAKKVKMEDTTGLTPEQKERLRLTYGALNVLRVWQELMEKDDPGNEMAKWLKSYIHHMDAMVHEWRFAIGHPAAISEETMQEIVDRAMPVIGSVIKQRIREGTL